MKKKANINMVLNSLNLDKNSEKRLEQILTLCKKIPALKLLEIVAKNTKKGDYSEHNIYGKDDSAFIDYTIKKEKAEKENLTDNINIFIKDQQQFIADVGFKEQESFRINNLSESNIFLFYENKKEYFVGRREIEQNNVEFKFDKKNQLVGITASQTSKRNAESVYEIKRYSKSEIKKLIENSQSEDLDFNRSL